VAKYDVPSSTWVPPSIDPPIFTIAWFKKAAIAPDTSIGSGVSLSLDSASIDTRGIYYAKINDTLQLSDITVDVKVPSTVTVQFLDEAGIALAPSRSLDGFSGDSYNTSPDTITGYELKKTPSNATGVFGDETNTVIYTYKQLPFFELTEGAFVFVLDNNTATATVKGYNGASKDPIIPSSTQFLGKDYTVTAIGDSAFNNKGLTSVVIPDSVISIRQSAFSYNQLTSVALPNSVINIEDFAFYSNRLTAITLPEDMTSIGERAFGWNKLTSVVIPDSVTNIGVSAFEGNALEQIYISSISNLKVWETILTKNDGLNGITSEFVHIYAFDHLDGTYKNPPQLNHTLFEGDSYCLEIGEINNPVLHRYDVVGNEWLPPSQQRILLSPLPVSVEWYKKGINEPDALIGNKESLSLENANIDTRGIYYAKVNDTLQLSDITIDVKIASQVAVEFLTETKKPLIPPITLNGFSGDPYTTIPKAIDGYELISTPVNATGFFSDNQTTVTYIYREIPRIEDAFKDKQKPSNNSNGNSHSSKSGTRPNTGNSLNIPLIIGGGVLVLLISSLILIFFLYKEKNHFFK
ncbi:MAG: MucBP domain-containing protein, partial [Eubacteriaceae bacterium]